VNVIDDTRKAAGVLNKEGLVSTLEHMPMLIVKSVEPRLANRRINN
jgi:hypothetical protein